MLPHPTQVSNSKPALWLAQGFNVLSSVYVSGLKVFGSRKRHERDRLIREQVAGIMGTRRAVPEQINPSDRFILYWHCIPQQQLDTFWEKHDSPESRAIREESKALKQIRDSAGEDTEAEITGYRQYINEHPKSHLAFFFLGTTLQKMGRLEESLSAYQQDLSIKQRKERAICVITRLAIGDVLQEIGRLDDAIAEYRAAINDNAAGELSRIFHARIYLHLGDALKRQDRLREARKAWKQAVKLDQTRTIHAEVSKRLRQNSLFLNHSA